jgi:hypothetical protein
MAVVAARAQFQALFDTFFATKQTADIASLVDAAGATQTFAVPGVVLGDMVIGISAGVSLAGMTVTGYVSAADVVTIRVQNESTATVDLASTSWNILVGRPSASYFR